MRISGWSSDVCSSDLEAAVEQRHALHLHVDAGPGLAEQVVEDLVDRVGEHERARHERHAEHDGEHRRDHPAMVLPEGAEGEIGRETWREKVGPYGVITGGTGSSKKKKKRSYNV